MLDLDLSSLIVGLAGVIATAFGLREARRGRLDTRAQQVAANKLQAEQLQLEEYRALVPDLRTEKDRAQKDRDEARTEAVAERVRRVEAESAADLARQEARAAEERAAVLTMLVLSEIDREADRTAQAFEDRKA